MKINRLFLAGAIGCALAFQPLACGAEPVRLTLADSIHMALESDESIESAEAQREASEHAFHAARRSHGPPLIGNHRLTGSEAGIIKRRMMPMMPMALPIRSSGPP